MEKKYSYEDFLKIIETLRSEGGCPWDREQTHLSLRPCLMEETAEVLAGIRIYEQTGDYENLREELGDVLLQVVMHAQIAKEEGIFTMEDVVDEVATKMVRRHPHVFGTEMVSGSDQVLQNWEEIKKKEKEGKTVSQNPLREIPIELQALAKGTKVLKKVDKLYASGKTMDDSLLGLEKAVEMLKTCNTGNPEDVSEQIGALLLEICNISRICKIAPEQVLEDKIENMIAKYDV